MKISVQLKTLKPVALPSIRLVEAIRFSALKHTAQRRKDPEATPYLNHPIEVMHILATEGGVRDENILMGGVLHDTIEDTNTSYRELVAEFGISVADYVLEMTDNKNLNWATRKKLQIEHSSQISAGAGEIKRADKIANMRDIASNPPVGWDWMRQANYFVWGNAVLAGISHKSALIEVANAAYSEGLQQIVFQAMLDAKATSPLLRLTGLRPSLQVEEALKLLPKME